MGSGKPQARCQCAHWTHNGVCFRAPTAEDLLCDYCREVIAEAAKHQASHPGPVEVSREHD